MWRSRHTSSLRFKWDQIFKDTMTTAAAIDRVVHHSVILELVTDSLQFQTYYEAAAKPFQWKFTRRDLAKLLSKLSARGNSLAKAA